MDDSWLCVEIMGDILRRRGRKPIPIKQYRELFCFPVQQYYQSLQFDPQLDPFEQVSHEFIGEYESRRTECHLFPGATDLLAQWQTSGVEQVILSAYRHETLLEIVSHFEISDYFQKLIGLGDIYAQGKTELAVQHVSALDQDPHHILLIGDTVHDAEVAQAVGAECILLSHGHNSTARLRATGYPVVNSMTELSTLVDRS